jgi:hypothetical protein
MSGLAVPLSVRLHSILADKNVTSELRGLQFRSAVSGGYASASIALDRDLALSPDEIGYYAGLTVYDQRSNEVVWDGWQEDLGRGASRDGQVWHVNAVGPAAHARDRTIPLIYVDRNLRAFEEADIAVSRSGQVTLPGDHGATPTMQMQYSNGTAVVTNTRVVRAYPLLRASGQRLARFDYTWTSGSPSIDWRVQAVVRGGAGAAATARDNALNAASGGSVAKVITTDFANDRDWLELRMLWQGGAATVAGDTTWVAIADPYVMATRYNKAGSQLLLGASYTAGTVLASQVVEDLLGRLLPLYDGANASVAATSYTIDQLAYPDGVTAAQVLDDLIALEAGYYWAAWEANTSGLYRFEWRAWPDYVRYEATVLDGFDSPGSAVDLYNSVRVRYREFDGTINSVVRTSTVAELDAAGRTREAFTDLGDNVGSLANANRVGDQFLAEHNTPPNAGILTVARPIQDTVRGAMVEPWLIKPGELIRVRGVLPRVNALNATARDGVGIFRIMSVTFNADTVSSVLGLDSLASTVTNQVATLLSRPDVRRR